MNNFRTWRSRAKRRLPKVVFDFIDGGAEDEVTLRHNRAAFEDLCLVPRLLRGTSEVSVDVELFGRRLRLPVLLAPTGGGQMAHRHGELVQARAASAAGTISVLSCFGSFPPEQVARAVSEPQWFQLYPFRDRSLAFDLIERVKRLGFSALVVTADTPVVGNRERDTRNGLGWPLKVNARIASQVLRHPRWVWQYWRAKRMAVPRDTDSPRDFQASIAYAAAMLSPQQTWDDVRWLRSVWDGPLILKGVLCGEDAELAIAAGCDGVIVSNHGGRQLDSTPAAIEVLPEVVAAVGRRAEVLIDGGFRRGTDVVKALSLGAKACLVGRPWLFAAASGGEAGVKQMLEQFRTEIARTLRLLGVSEPAELMPSFVWRRPGSGWRPVQPAWDQVRRSDWRRKASKGSLFNASDPARRGDRS